MADPSPTMPETFAAGLSFEDRFIEAVVARLKTTDLPGIPKERILVQSIGWAPDPKDVPPPYIIVSHADEETPWERGSNERDTTIFAVVVAAVVANQRNPDKFRRIHLYWRERIRRKFQSLSSRFAELVIPDQCTVKHAWIQQGAKFLEAAKIDQRDVSYFLIRCEVREPRE